MIASRLDGELWGVTAWRTTGADRGSYQEEHDGDTGAASAVLSVRPSQSTYDAVRDAAARAHLTSSALIRQWVTERVEESGSGYLATAVATLRRDVERVADLVQPA